MHRLLNQLQEGFRVSDRIPAEQNATYATKIKLQRATFRKTMEDNRECNTGHFEGNSVAFQNISYIQGVTLKKRTFIILCIQQ